MAVATITKRAVDSAEAGFLWDDKIRGFGLKVTPAGGRIYVLQFRTGGRGTPTKRVTIGKHGAPWTPDEARREARRLLGDVAAGRDPAGERAAKREGAGTGLFRQRAEAFLEHGRRKRGLPLRPATKREYQRALLTYAADLHGRPLAEIRRAEVAGVIQRVARAHGEVTAMRTRAALSRLYSWAIANGYAEANPVTGTEGYGTPKRSRVLSDAELRAIWTATAAPTDFHLIVRLLLWTGARRGEVGGMAEAELDGGVWSVPGERTKNGRPLVLPLPDQAQAALAAWPRIEGRGLLFGRGESGFQGWSKAKERLDAKLGFDWNLHDVRRTVETGLARIGVPKEIANRVLNHAVGPITEAYDLHSYRAEKAGALQRWADEVDRIVKGEADSREAA